MREAEQLLTTVKNFAHQEGAAVILVSTKNESCCKCATPTGTVMRGWAHCMPASSQQSRSRLASLVKLTLRLVITYAHGPSQSYPASPSDRWRRFNAAGSRTLQPLQGRGARVQKRACGAGRESPERRAEKSMVSDTRGVAAGKWSCQRAHPESCQKAGHRKYG